MRSITKLFAVPFAVFTITASAQPDTSALDTDSLGTDYVPNFSVTFDELEGESATQDISGLLQSSRDVFTSMAGFNFSGVRYRIRGYQSELYSINMNGMPMNDPESGWGIWAFWGGLNDITRYPEQQTGISGSNLTFGAIGGYSNLQIRPTMKRAGTRLTYSYSNRSYRHRVMATHSTGLMANGWAFTVSISGRYGEEGYVDATSYSAASYFIGAEKKLNERQSIALVAFGAPAVRGRAGIALQEVYDLTGNNYYNPYWGYQTQDGKQVKRNARVRDTHKPYVFLIHTFDIDEKTKLNTSAFASFGRNGQTNINWYDAADPRPDYYRYLPSWYEQTDPERAAELTALWQANDPSVTQLDWDQFYFANSKNLYTLNDANGVAGATETGNRAKFIVEEYRNDPLQFGLHSDYTKTMSDHISVTGGFNGLYHRTRNYRQLDDLLGADFWIDVDQFAEQDFEDPNASQNDLNNPNRLVTEGDAFGYNYDMNVMRAETYGLASFNYPKWDAFVGLDLSYTSFYRKGNYQNGRFPESSFGKGETHNFFNYGVKGGFVYKISGRMYATANGSYQTRAPFARNSYIAPRVRDKVVDNLQSVNIMSGDVNFILRYTDLELRATGYYTQVNNDVWNRSFYHDIERTFVNYVMTDVDQTFMGVELGVRGNVASVIELSGAFAMGEFFYSNRPTATITADNNSELLASDRTIYLENFRIGGAPQTIASVGVRYNSPKFWFIGANFNYYADLYLAPNPDRRTVESTQGYAQQDPQWDYILDQTKLDNGYTLSAFAGYSYRIAYGKYIRVNASVNNILNDQNLRVWGYEQLRFDPSNPGTSPEDPGKFPNKYRNMFGTTYFLMLTFIF